ncbi:HNH_endonuclease [Hexamita inflata]|uniref:HNH_endonuclease n=1 Tax=Hexamita inflata TaxID=28002 RepID=A0ABP1MMC4_9EUKA
MNKEKNYEEQSYNEESSQEELIEEYRDIDDFENYEVSNLGQVRNKKTGRILKPSDINKGYLQVCLYQNKIRKHFIYINQQHNHFQKTQIIIKKQITQMHPDQQQRIKFKVGSKSDNNKNKNSNNFGNKFIFIDQLPEDAVEVYYYSNHYFKDYYWSQTLNQLYFNNGVRIREVIPQTQKSIIIIIVETNKMIEFHYKQQNYRKDFSITNETNIIIFSF